MKQALLIRSASGCLLLCVSLLLFPRDLARIAMGLPKPFNSEATWGEA
ncbi:MAG: hypothetical protein ACPGU1_12690 [Myxococcota bacterium]